MRKYILQFLAAVIFAGCGPCRSLTSSTADTTRIETVVRTEFVNDTVYLEIPKEIVREVVFSDSSLLRTEMAVSEAKILSDGRLYHSLENVAQKRPFEVKKEIEYRDSIVYRDRTVNEVVEVQVEKPLSGWQRFKMSGFWFLTAIAICVVASRFKI